MNDVCIVGIGIHPFGRTEGRSGRDQGVFAVRQALADAGIDWDKVQFGYGGSSSAGNADLIVNELGIGHGLKRILLLSRLFGDPAAGITAAARAA